jgi:hypothetical protein
MGRPSIPCTVIFLTLLATAVTCDESRDDPLGTSATQVNEGISDQDVRRAELSDDVVIGQVESTRVAPCSEINPFPCTTAEFRIHRSLRNLSGNIRIISAGGELDGETFSESNSALLLRGDYVVAFLLRRHPEYFVIQDGPSGYLRIVDDLIPSRNNSSPDAYLDDLAEALR